MIKKLLVILAVVCSVSSCEWVSSLVHGGDVVASLGANLLYRSQLKAVIPDGVSPEDSARLAGQYINSWATEMMFMDMATEQLSVSERDVTTDLEAYRRSLLRYRYEQRYVNERLDTTITDAQIEAYYDAHKDLFTLERPILKVRYVDIMSDSQAKDVILKKMSSDNYEDVMDADSLAFSFALKYFDNSDIWMDSAVLAEEFGMDHQSMLALLKGKLITVEPEGRGDVKVAYVRDIQRSGHAPVDYCSGKIRDIILANRKRALLTTLEQDLLERAVSTNKLTIYDK